MDKINALYKCEICGNIVEMCHLGKGELMCCNQYMKLLKENIADSNNFHFANVENINELEKKITFKHPMTKEHHIEFVEAISKDEKHIKRKYFNSDDILEMNLKCNCEAGFDVRLYCNLDGVWRTEI